MNPTNALLSSLGCALVLAACSSGSDNPTSHRTVTPGTGQVAPQGASGANQTGVTQGTITQTVNQAPTLGSIGEKSVRAGSSLAVTAVGKDPEGGPLTYRFSTVGDVLPAATSEFGLFQLAVPATLGSGTITGIIQVVDSGGMSAHVTFPIKIEGASQPSMVNTIINKTCDVITDPLQKSICQLAGGIVK